MGEFQQPGKGERFCRDVLLGQKSLGVQLFQHARSSELGVHEKDCTVLGQQHLPTLNPKVLPEAATDNRHAEPVAARLRRLLC